MLFNICTILTQTIRHIQTALRLSLVVNFKILYYEINLRTVRSLRTHGAIITAKYNLTARSCQLAVRNKIVTSVCVMQ